jgi:hypothetical protein
MHTNLRLVLAVTALLVLAACDPEKVELLKSPCASLDGGPCGPKRTPAGNAAITAVEQA